VSHVSYATRKELCGLSGCTLFSTLSLKPHDFLKNLLIIKRVFSFSLQHLSETFLILGSIQRDTVAYRGGFGGSNIRLPPPEIPKISVVSSIA